MEVDYINNGKYKIGDKVVVVAPKDERSTAGTYEWVDSMDKFIGKEFTITKVEKNYYNLDDDDEGWNWNYDEPWLIPAEPEPQLDIPDLSVLGL